MSALDLTDVTIAITRPDDRSQTLAKRLEKYNATVSIVPLIGTHPPDDEGESFLAGWNRLADFTWVAVTSASSVEIISSLGVGIDIPPSVSFAAVGMSTARALAAIGIEADLIGSGSGGASLAEALIDEWEPSAILVLKAQDGRRELEERLQQHGWKISLATTYVTRAFALSQQACEALSQQEVIVVASPSAVVAYSEALEGRCTPRKNQSIVAIGATTADAAKEQGFPRVVVAPTPDDAGLLRAIEEAVFGKWPVA